MRLYQNLNENRGCYFRPNKTYLGCVISWRKSTKDQIKQVCHLDGGWFPAKASRTFLYFTWCILGNAVHCINLAYLCQISYLIWYNVKSGNFFFIARKSWNFPDNEGNSNFFVLQHQNDWTNTISRTRKTRNRAFLSFNCRAIVQVIKTAQRGSHEGDIQ